MVVATLGMDLLVWDLRPEPYVELQVEAGAVGGVKEHQSGEARDALRSGEVRRIAVPHLPRQPKWKLRHE